MLTRILAWFHRRADRSAEKRRAEATRLAVEAIRRLPPAPPAPRPVRSVPEFRRAIPVAPSPAPFARPATTVVHHERDSGPDFAMGMVMGTVLHSQPSVETSSSPSCSSSSWSDSGSSWSSSSSDSGSSFSSCD